RRGSARTLGGRKKKTNTKTDTDSLRGNENRWLPDRSGPRRLSRPRSRRLGRRRVGAGGQYERRKTTITQLALEPTARLMLAAAAQRRRGVEERRTQLQSRRQIHLGGNEYRWLSDRLGRQAGRANDAARQTQTSRRARGAHTVPQPPTRPGSSRR